MRKKNIVFLSGLVGLLIWSCGHNMESKKDAREEKNRILQQEDGIVSLKLDKATCYSDAVSPSNNTADWNIVISKPGRFKVWLSNATRDTSDLRYANSVIINMLDDHLDVNPLCDKVVHNSGDVHYPYYRADSYMGSVYVSEPGEYNIQVISEKVIGRTVKSQNTSLADDTKLMSVILTPITY